MRSPAICQAEPNSEMKWNLEFVRAADLPRSVLQDDFSAELRYEVQL